MWFIQMKGRTLYTRRKCGRGVEALAVFCSVVDMDTQRGKYRHRPRRACIRRRVAPLFGRSLFVGASVLFCQNNSPFVVWHKTPRPCSFAGVLCLFVCLRCPYSGRAARCCVYFQHVGRKQTPNAAGTFRRCPYFVHVVHIITRRGS